MQSGSGLTDIMGRIGRIESNFGAVRAQSQTQVLLGEQFDAFGDTYQRALATTQGAPGSAPTVAPPASGQTLPPRTLDLRASAQQFRSLSVAPQSTGSSTGSTPSSSTGQTGGANRIGGFGKLAPPSDLADLGNGRIPSDHLQPIAQSGHRLYGPAATAWDGLVSAAAADGIEMRITDSYRSYDNQVDLARRKGLYKDGGLAAVPGTSNHGWGLAVDADVRDPKTLAWIRENGPRFGFVEAVPREPWHWEYRPDQV